MLSWRDLVVKQGGGGAGGRDCGNCPCQLRLRAHEHTDLFRLDASRQSLRDPLTDRSDLGILVCEECDRGRRAVEDRDRATAILSIAVNIGQYRWQQPV